jgi:hypothetical protein
MTQSRRRLPQARQARRPLKAANTSTFPAAAPAQTQAPPHQPPDWLLRMRVTDTPEGDLIADMRDARDLPQHFDSIDAMRGYLWSKHACWEALAAVPAVWRRYKRLTGQSTTQQVSPLTPRQIVRKHNIHGKLKDFLLHGEPVIGRRSDVHWWMARCLRERLVPRSEAFVLLKFTAWNKHRHEKRCDRMVWRLIDKAWTGPFVPWRQS